MLLDELVEDRPAFAIAAAYAFWGDSDRAFEWLERAYAERDGGGLAFTKVHPLLANLHDDPRWPVFLDKMGLAG